MTEPGLSGGWLSAVILGVVEGATEFLPISSTGHLIVTAAWLGENSEAAKLFEVVIQLGAILAVCVHYRARLSDMARNFASANTSGGNLLRCLIIAFLPAAALGALFHADIKALLFAPAPVAIALIIGGVIIIIVERRPRQPRILSIDALTPKDALVIGCAQSLALIPGVSRAGATIIGAMLWGAERRVAAEFSFLLALPTMVAATTFDLVQNRDLVTADFAAQIAVGFAVSFVTALAVIRALIRFVSRHTFAPFGYYRIVFGIIVLFVLSNGE